MPDEPRMSDEVDLDTYASVSAHLWHYGPARRTEVFRRLGVTQEAWAAAHTRYAKDIDDELEREETTTARRFALSASEVKRRLKQENPSIESLGPLGTKPETAGDAEAAPEPTPPHDVPKLAVELAPSPQPPAPAPSLPVEVPSFLLAAEREPSPVSPSFAAEPSPHAAEPAMASPAGTLPVFILPRSISLPFAGSASPGQAVQRAKAHAEVVQGPAAFPRAQIGETVAPSDLAAVMQRVMPFASRNVSERPAPGVAAPPPTAALPGAPAPHPAPVRLVAQTPATTPQASNAPAHPVTSPMLSLEQYASLCEDLRIAGDRGAEVLKRYGLSPEGKRAVDEHWQRQFQAQATTYLAWERARSTYRAWLMQRGGK